MQMVQLLGALRVYQSRVARRATRALELEDRRASDLKFTGGTSFGTKGPLTGPFSVLLSL